MKSEFYWKFIAFVLTIMLPLDSSGEKVWEIPFDKAKVRYHRSRVCLTIKGETHCTSKNKAPGNPHEIAALFKHLKSVNYLSADGDSKNDTLMMPGKVAAKPKTKDEDNGLFMKATDIDNQGKFVEMLIAENCTKIVNCRDKSVKTIIAATDVVHECIGDITRALSKHGTVIIVGKEKEDINVAISRIHELTDLCFDKHYDLPENIKHVTTIMYDNSDLEIKPFVTSATLLEQLHELISDQKYKEAVDMIKYLQNINKRIVPKVCAQLPQKGNGYKLMDFVYKLVQNNEKAMINDFPLVFQWIFNGDTVRLQNKERNSKLWLTNRLDVDLDRWLITDCDGAKEGNGLFKFIPVWDTILNCTFQIHNPLFRMKFKLDRNIVHKFKYRMAFGDASPVDINRDRFRWRLKPALNENGAIAFCLVDVVYDSYLSQGDCNSFIIGIKDTCTPDMGWIIDKP